MNDKRRLALPGLVVGAMALGLAAATARDAGAQDSTVASRVVQGATASTAAGVALLPAGGEWERYLRAMQLTGQAPLRPWAVRGFGPRELPALMSSAQPAWLSGQMGQTRSIGKLEWAPLALSGTLVGNTAFPYGFNDGPLWAGRGITAAAQGGVAARYGVLSVAVDPMVFVAQNAAFALAPTGLAGSQRFANISSPTTIDLPQRFGDGVYARLDPGESYARVDAGPVTAGFSTAAQVYGPAVEHPLILGNNAGGFPHAFAGTSRPLDLWLVTIHGRMIWGRLTGSAFTTESAARFATAAVGTMGIRGAPGLEIGGVRFFHAPWPSRGLLHAPYLSVLEGILKTSLTTPDNPSGDVPDDNQLASAFFRWAFPSYGLEVYGEYGREDHSWDLRDFWLEPDHDAGYLIGLQRAWRNRPGQTLVFRAEHLNTRISPLVMAAKQTPWYEHGILRAGHTYRGQVLGSAGGFGGGATSVAVDRYSANGRWTIRWDRLMRAELRSAENLPVAGRGDVQHAWGVERTTERGKGVLTVGANAVLELNRNFGRDAFNANVSATYRRFFH